jgi:hypothetical protein
MDPITNSKYSDDFHKFVLQDQGAIINPQAKVPKPFSLNPPEKSKKTKKDLKKGKDDREEKSR